MKTHIFTTSCFICGGEGMADVSGVYREAVHEDPKTCQYFLEQEKERVQSLEARNRELESKLKELEQVHQ